MIAKSKKEAVEAVRPDGAKVANTVPKSTQSKQEKMNSELLRRARKCDRVGCMEAIARGADPGAQCKRYGETALMIALEKDHEDLARELARAMNKTQLDAVTLGGHTAMDFVVEDMLCEESSANMVEYLAKLGADVDGRNPDGGMTTLMLAAMSGRASVVQALLDAGADARACAVSHDGTDTTALMLALSSGKHDVARILGPVSDLSIKVFGRAPLFVAIHEGDAELVEALAGVESCAELDSSGRMALDLTITLNSPERVKIASIVLSFSDPWRTSGSGMIPLETLANEGGYGEEEEDEQIANMLADAMMTASLPDYAKLVALCKAWGMAVGAGVPGVITALAPRVKVLEDKMDIGESLPAKVRKEKISGPSLVRL